MPHPTDDLADNWCALARRVLNQALRDARLPQYRYDVGDFAESDWCAAICEMVGLQWRPYANAVASLLSSGVSAARLASSTASGLGG